MYFSHPTNIEILLRLYTITKFLQLFFEQLSYLLMAPVVNLIGIWRRLPWLILTNTSPTINLIYGLAATNIHFNHTYIVLATATDMRTDCEDNFLPIDLPSLYVENEKGDILNLFEQLLHKWRLIFQKGGQSSGPYARHKYIQNHEGRWNISEYFTF